MREADRPGRAIRELLRADRTFADEPRRLRRGLLDLLPADDRAVGLLTVGAETGVPALVRTGDRAAAQQRLIDEAGLRPEVADWVVAVWAASYASTAPTTPSPDGPPAARMATAEAVRLAAWPDGSLLVVAIGGTGVYAATVNVRTANPTQPDWQQVSAPQSPPSRDVAVAVDGSSATIAWSDTDGVFASTVRQQGSGLAVEPPRLVVSGAADQQIRYPIGVLAVDGGSLDVFWSPDRQQLRRNTWRQWSADAGVLTLDACCGSGEHIGRLDVGRAGSTQAWLVVCTDRGRVLVARWDLARDDISAWAPVPLPDPALDAAVGGHSVFVCTQARQLVAVNAEALVARSGAEVSPLLRFAAPPRSLAVASTDAGIWWALGIETAGFLLGVGPDGQLLPEPLPLWPADR